MEIVAGEHACYTLLAFILLKTELHWRSNPVGKVPKNFLLIKLLEGGKISHKTLDTTSIQGNHDWKLIRGQLCQAIGMDELAGWLGKCLPIRGCLSTIEP